MPKIFLLLSFLFTSTLYANYFSWKLLSQDFSRVIKRNKTTHLIGQYPYSIFISGAREGKDSWEKKYKKIQFDIKAGRNFVIIISVNTSLGIKDLTYTSGEKETNTYLGLGIHTTNNRWHTFSRDIQSDLQKLYPNHKLKTINSMVIRGRVSIKNIKFKNRLFKMNKKKFVKIPKKKSIPYKKHNTPPKIILNKNSKHIYTLGEKFIFPDVKAIDIYGNILKIERVGYVDTKKVGKYVLNYIAIDKAGNVAIKGEVIIVQNTDTNASVKTSKEKYVEKKKKDIPTSSKKINNENISEIIMTEEMILENEYIKELIATDFAE